VELLERITRATGFDWDAGNVQKNWERHAVRFSECEEVFFRAPLLAVNDPKDSRREGRFAALGRTALGRLLSIVFTFREQRIRVISARDMSRKERQEYSRHEET
jgi:uncharacterized protein